MDEVLKFDNFINEMKKNEIDGKGQIVKYRYFDYFNKTYREVRCEVLSYNEKAATIKLLGFGKNGERPGTVKNRIKFSSLVGFEPEFPVDPDTEYEEEEEKWWQK
jgi:hypothetical protein